MKIKATSNIDLGNNIKQVIQAKKLRKADIIRQMQLAGIPMTKQRFYKLENDQANITADELVMIAEIIGCDIAEFFKKSE